MTDLERAETIAAAILRYLRVRPGAADSLEGIHRWWIDWGEQEEPIDCTEQALNLLVERGYMECKTIAGRKIWRLRSSTDLHPPPQ